MKPMSLMDEVHAWTFATKTNGYRVTPAMAEVQRTFRAKLRAAEHFSLDDDAVRLITYLADEERDRLEGCIGCGCLSLDRCGLYNPGDRAAKAGPGPRFLLGDRAADFEED